MSEGKHSRKEKVGKGSHQMLEFRSDKRKYGCSSQN